MKAKPDAIKASFQKTAAAAGNDIKALKQQLQQISQQIMNLSKLKSENYDAIQQLKQKQKDIQGKISKLEQIRADCLGK